MSILIQRHMTFKLRCSTFGKQISPLTRSRPVVPCGTYLLFHVYMLASCWLQIMYDIGSCLTVLLSSTALSDVQFQFSSKHQNLNGLKNVSVSSCFLLMTLLYVLTNIRNFVSMLLENWLITLNIHISRRHSVENVQQHHTEVSHKTHRQIIWSSVVAVMFQGLTLWRSDGRLFPLTFRNFECLCTMSMFEHC